MRGLSRRSVAFPVAGGLDTKTDLRWVGPGRWQTLENAYQDKTGRLRKRYGVTSVSRTARVAGVATASDVSGAGSLFSLSGSRMGYVSDRGKLLWRLGADASAGWSRATDSAHGVMGHALPVFAPVDSTRTNHLCVKAASLGGVTVVAWSENITSPPSITAKVVFIEEATGNRISAHASYDNIAVAGNAIQLVKTANYISLFYITGSGITISRINPTTPGVAATTTAIAAGGGIVGIFDVIASEAAGEGDIVYWAMQDHVDQGKIRRGAWNVGTAATHVAATTAGAYAAGAFAEMTSCAWFYQADWSGDLTLTLGAGYGFGGPLECRIVKFTRSTMAQSGADFLVGAALLAGPYSIGGVAANVRGPGSNATIWFSDLGTVYQTDTVLLDAGKTVYANSSDILSRPFRATVDQAVYMVVAMVREFQPTTFLMQVAKTDDSGTLSSSSLTVARYLAGSTPSDENGGVAGVLTGPPSIVSSIPGGNDMIGGAGFLQAIPQEDPRQPISFYRGAGIVRFKWDRTLTSQPQEYAGNVYFPGGMVCIPTPGGLESHAPLLFPTRASWNGGIGAAFTQSGGGSLTATGVYQYCYVYVYYDALAGAVVRSDPSVPETVTLTGANNRITISLVPLGIARAQSSLSAYHIEVYRTEAGLSQFYRETTLTTVVTNSAAATISYVSSIADTALVLGERLYTTGGNLGNYPAPPCAILQAHRGRLWAAAVDEPGALWYTDEVLPGEGAAFNPRKKVKMDQRDGQPTAFASLDDKLIIFKRNSVWALNGNGPDRRGQGQVFAQPEQLPVEAGTILPRSVATTPEGLIFKSTAGGWYKLGRDLSTEYIGAPVEAFNAYTITGCAVLPGVNQVRWSTSNGTTIVYDYFFKQWSTFTNQAAASGCGLFGGKWSFMTSTGALMEETTSYDDAGSFISMRLVSPPLSLVGIAGLQRIYGVRIVADYIGDHTLRVKFAYDYAEAYPGSPEQPTIRPSTILKAGNVFEALAKVAQQRCSAIRIEILDEAVAGNTGGYALSALALEYGALPGARRLPSSSVMS